MINHYGDLQFNLILNQWEKEENKKNTEMGYVAGGNLLGFGLNGLLIGGPNGGVIGIGVAFLGLNAVKSKINSKYAEQTY